jgi:hypothetical protein
MVPFASRFFDPGVIPQDLVAGIIAAFIGLVILYSLKPHLVVEPVKPKVPSEKGQLTFLVTNRGLIKVNEVRASLYEVREPGDIPARYPIELAISELFELPGRLSLRAARPASPGQQPGARNEFRFRSGPGVHIPFSVNSSILFQVSAKHNFTGYTKLFPWCGDIKELLYSPDDSPLAPD